MRGTNGENIKKNIGGIRARWAKTTSSVGINVLGPRSKKIGKKKQKQRVGKGGHGREGRVGKLTWCVTG